MTILTAELLDSFDASIADVTIAITMPPEIYTSEEFLRFERDAVFAREWQCVGRASRIPNVGDYFTTTANAEPIIVTRAKDGEIHAFSAICQHRGMQVVDDEATAPSSPARTTCGATTSPADCSARRRWSEPTASTGSSSRCPR